MTQMAVNATAQRCVRFRFSFMILLRLVILMRECFACDWERRAVKS